MAEEFQQAGLCGGGSYYWWNNTASSASPCSTALGGFAWPTSTADTRSSCDEEEATATGDAELGDVEKPNNELLLDSTLQMMGFGLSSSSDQWCQSNHLLRSSGGEGETNYNSVLLQDMDWRSPPKSFSSEEDDHSPSNKELTNTFLNASAADHNNSFVSTNNYSGSTLLQTLFEDDHHHQPQPSLFGNMGTTTTTTTSLNAPSPFLQQQQAAAHDSSFNTPFWSASAAPDLTDNNIRASFFSPKSQFVTPSFEEKPNYSGLLASKTNMEQVRDSSSVVKRGNSDQQQAFKRPRIETPSTLPTFKVRKEKLGDRITALQQLVSPFGKTDTASVLHEAIEYIKFLHDQVNVLSSPYMKNGVPLQNQDQQPQACSDHHQYNVKRKERELSSAGEDLRSRGLCLVPISSTFPVANETTADFWTPTFGATFR